MKHIVCFLKLQHITVILPEGNWELACTDCFGGTVLRVGLSVLTSGANAVFER